MIRPAFTEVGIFLIPFAIYVLYLVATRSGLLVQNSWPLRLVLWLGVAAMVLVVLSFVMLAHFSNAPPSSSYVPAHVENGKLVPGVEK
jgi:4-amino-4-deoxy-L-arabinose transferase-like glycosyltransferase